MNKIVNKFLLTEEKFMPKLHSRQPLFTCSACRQFTRHHERIRKFKETSDLNHIYKNKLHKSYFVHDTGHANSKD